MQECLYLEMFSCLYVCAYDHLCVLFCMRFCACMHMCDCVCVCIYVIVCVCVCVCVIVVKDEVNRRMDAMEDIKLMIAAAKKVCFVSYLVVHCLVDRLVGCFFGCLFGCLSIVCLFVCVRVFCCICYPCHVGTAPTPTSIHVCILSAYTHTYAQTHAWCMRTPAPFPSR